MSVLARRFSSWSLDFIVDLPLSDGFNAILTIVDRLIKLVKLVPCFMGGNSLSAKETEHFVFRHIFSCFGVPDIIVHDRDPRFTLEL